ncbi:hypothetical protein QCM77_12590 [Bradyrhizobium sp. SSUT18]|uniref:hypothetical protein n=1 Tax=Bradyrhizobium sp. SSUT18 TaxID=3040602 RepID=UPI00244A9FC7|nr:hypothetical protein [Bradyrhizobium sp. SSUT18]MDH2400773.1 hypothetical protein [Bradyrhizobium sp. SSUT18]
MTKADSVHSTPPLSSSSNNIIDLSAARAQATSAATPPPENVAEVKRLPYEVTRRIHSRKPRRSKNGTPEERAAKAAASAALPSATIIELQRPPKRALLQQEFEAKLNELDPLGRKYIEGYMQALLDQRGLR